MRKAAARENARLWKDIKGSVRPLLDALGVQLAESRWKASRIVLRQK